MTRPRQGRSVPFAFCWTLRTLPLDTLRAEALLPQRTEADRVWVAAVLAELRRRGAA